MAIAAPMLASAPARLASPPNVATDARDQSLVRGSRAAERAELSAELAARVRQQALTTQRQATVAQQAALNEQAAAKKKAAAKAASKAEATKKAKKAAEAEKRAKKKQAAASKSNQSSSGNPKAIARSLMQSKYGWGASQFSCYNKIIMRESAWKVHADNPSSSAYGIPQALPGRKMASAGPDWRNNARTQIKWGLGYVKSRYGTPCSAWGFKRSHGWY